MILDTPPGKNIIKCAQESETNWTMQNLYNSNYSLQACVSVEVGMVLHMQGFRSILHQYGAMLFVYMSPYIKESMSWVGWGRCYGYLCPRLRRRVVCCTIAPWSFLSKTVNFFKIFLFLGLRCFFRKECWLRELVRYYWITLLLFGRRAALAESYVWLTRYYWTLIHATLYVCEWNTLTKQFWEWPSIVLTDRFQTKVATQSLGACAHKSRGARRISKMQFS